MRKTCRMNDSADIVGSYTLRQTILEIDANGLSKSLTHRSDFHAMSKSSMSMIVRCEWVNLSFPAKPSEPTAKNYSIDI
jgi:hypothetical protein